MVTNLHLQKHDIKNGINASNRTDTQQVCWILQCRTCTVHHPLLVNSSLCHVIHCLELLYRACMYLTLQVYSITARGLGQDPSRCNCLLDRLSRRWRCGFWGNSGVIQFKTPKVANITTYSATIFTDFYLAFYCPNSYLFCRKFALFLNISTMNWNAGTEMKRGQVTGNWRSTLWGLNSIIT